MYTLQLLPTDGGEWADTVTHYAGLECSCRAFAHSQVHQLLEDGMQNCLLQQG